MAISLRDDAALCWPSQEDHSARLSLLLSSGSRVRILPGALVRALLGAFGDVTGSQKGSH